jgi:epoxyqueuosine reductase
MPQQHQQGGQSPHQPVATGEVPGAGLMEPLREWARELGFSQIGVADVNLSSAEPGLLAWLQAGFHGNMGYMARHGLKRARPAELVPGTVRVITARMDYLPRDTGTSWAVHEQARLQDSALAVVSVYARGRDYHKVMRARLQTLALRLAAAAGVLGHRVFTDSAPVLEVELASRSGLGWRGKHTLALSRDAGSMFFLGEIYIDLALPLTPATSAHCGQCSACITACPTGAITAPYRLDARLCISYLTIEHDGAIDPALRPLMGNRIYGCDDCQLVCPWNKYAQRSRLPDFDSRAPWGTASLLQLWAWDETQFLQRTEGSAIRRIGYRRWRRNLAVALGNALRSAMGEEAQQLSAALQAAPEHQDAAGHPLVAEHISWALAQRSA